jgi:O-antigen/teichoic acid export membrane protein
MIIGGLMTAGILANTPDLLLLLPDKFAIGENVIYIISIGTFLNMSTGLNDPIIFYSKKYQFGMLILLLLIVASFILNSIFIPDYGIVGAAMVAMILNMSYNIGKYLFIYLRFDLQPFTSDSLKILGIIILTTALGFLIPSIGEPISTLLFRSFVMLSLFVTLIVKLNLAPEVIKFLKRK